MVSSIFNQNIGRHGKPVVVGAVACMHAWSLVGKVPLDKEEEEEESRYYFNNSFPEKSVSSIEKGQIADSTHKLNAVEPGKRQQTRSAAAIQN